VALAREIASIVKNYDKPVVAVDTGWSETAILERREFDMNGIPAYPTPERAVKSLAGLIRYGEYLSRRGVLDRYIEGILRLRARD
ncbi:MAG: CoA-binding protein, partial [Thermofilum sp.]|nr:CoA-binding protein [Thermofilum sp.]